MVKNQKDCDCNLGCVPLVVVIILILVWGMSDQIDALVTKIDNLEKKIESTK